MKCSLTAVTVKNKRVLAHLNSYLDKMSARYSDSLIGSRVRVFVDSRCDFCAFESVEYVIGFTSREHAFRDAVLSRFPAIECTFDDFANHIRGLI